MECKCTFAKHMLGDGCDICNPAKALEYVRESLADTEAELARYKAMCERLAAELKSELNCNTGEEFNLPAHDALDDYKALKGE